MHHGRGTHRPTAALRMASNGIVRGMETQACDISLRVEACVIPASLPSPRDTSDRLPRRQGRGNAA